MAKPVNIRKENHGDFPKKYFAYNTFIVRNPDRYGNKSWVGLKNIYIVIGYYKDVNLGWCAQLYNVTENVKETYLFYVVHTDFKKMK